MSTPEPAREWGGLTPDVRDPPSEPEAIYQGPHPRLGPNLQKRSGGGHEEYSLVTCPARDPTSEGRCGYEFDANEKRSTHYARVHQPEDLGLTPIRRKPTTARLSSGGESGVVER